MRTYQDELSHSRARHCACMTMCQHSRDSLFRGRASWRPCPPAASPLPAPLELPPARLRRIWRRRCVRLPPTPRASRRPFRVPGDRRRSVRRERADPAARVGRPRGGGAAADPGFRFRFIFDINTRCRTGRNTHGAHRRGPLAFALFQERRRGGRQPRCARSRQLSPR